MTGHAPPGEVLISERLAGDAVDHHISWPAAAIQRCGRSLELWCGNGGLFPRADRRAPLRGVGEYLFW
jgi:hypothetical protein